MATQFESWTELATVQLPTGLTIHVEARGLRESILRFPDRVRAHRLRTDSYTRTLKCTLSEAIQEAEDS